MLECQPPAHLPKAFDAVLAKRQRAKVTAVHEVGRTLCPFRARRSCLVTNQLKPNAQQADGWRVAKKLKPGQRGAIKLGRTYGSELLCVRYRENPDGTERLTTVELVVERAVIQKREDPIVSFKIRKDELDLRREAKSRGAKYDPKTFMWRLPRSEVLRMGLKDRIAVTYTELYQEQVPF